MEPDHSPTDGRPRWRRLRLLLLGLVLCRGLVLLCALPPFEGWDEYQHVGYVQHVGETGRSAVLGETKVPASLLLALPEFPQSKHALDQVGRFGAVGYATYWAEAERRRGPGSPGSSRPIGREAPADLGLYQAQHGSLYYRIAAPIYAAAGGVGDLRSSVGSLRFLNLLLIAAAAWIAIETVGRIIPDARFAALVGLLIATQPLFLINGARVANDALGVLLATAAISLGLTLDGRHFLPRCLALGLLTGLAILAKAVNFGLVPFVAACWLIAVIRVRAPRGRAIVAAGLIALGAVAVAGPELHANLSRYGALTPMVEAMENRAAGRTASDLFRTALGIDWRAKLEGIWLHDNLFKGGWSFLDPKPRLLMRYHHLGLACLLGWAWLVHPRTRPETPVFRSWTVPVACLVLCLSYSATLAYHMIQTKLARGVPMTNTWYAAATLPWFLALVGGGGLAWPLGRFRPILPALLAATFVSTEWTVLWGRMIPVYAGGAGGREALRRLAFLQPAPFGTATLLAAMAGEVILIVLAVILWGRSAIDRRPEG